MSPLGDSWKTVLSWIKKATGYNACGSKYSLVVAATGPTTGTNDGECDEQVEPQSSD